jgi:carboxylesterase type B
MTTFKNKKLTINFPLKGIPFAESPLGSLRFSPLHKKKPWNMLWDATKYQAACLSVWI